MRPRKFLFSVVFAVVFAISAGALGGCSSNDASKATTTSTSRPASTSAPTTTAPRPIVTASGHGNFSTTAATLPAKWRLQWHWSCHGTKGQFSVTAVSNSGAQHRLTTQHGFGGGGLTAFPVTGKLSIRVATATSCTWSLKALQ